MLEFVNADLSKLDYAIESMKTDSIVGSDRVFGTFFIWNASYNSKIAKYGSYPIIRYGRNDFHFYVPLYKDKTKEMFEALIEFSESQNVKCSFGSIYEEDLEYIENLFPGKFEFIENRNYFDYIYKTENLALLAGRKYHSKRNHISKFKKLYSYEYIPFTKDNVSVCNEIMEEWCKDKEKPSEYDGEKLAIKRATEYFEELSLIGGYITVDGKPCAFNISEAVNCRLVDSHFEKALSGYDGLYAVINNEFAKSILGKYEYINREEDMGIEGLRKAKLSYYPDILLKKYNLKLK